MRLKPLALWLFCLLSFPCVADTLGDANMALRLGDFPLAVELFEQAALAGEPQAQYQLGQMVLAGRGVKADRQKGLNWLEQSARSGHVRAQYVLGLSLWQDGDEAGLLWLQQAADAGHDRARKRLLQIAESEVVADPTTDDPAAVASWWRDSINCRPEALLQRLKLGAQVNVRDAHGRNALHYLAACEPISDIAQLFKAGADPVVNDVYGVQPIDTAIARDNTALVRLLLDAGADPDRRLPTGDALLHLAVRAGSLESLSQLLRVAQRDDALDAQGYTALDRAAILHNEKAQKLLRGAGAVHGAQWQLDSVAAVVVSTNPQDSNAPLHWAAAVQAVLQNQVQQLQALQRQQGRLSLEFEDERGRTLLMYAVQAGALDAARYLLQLGAEPDQRNATGMSALMLAAQYAQLAMVVQLLEYGAEPLTFSPDGHDAILIALAAGADEVALALMQGVADGNLLRSDDYLRAAIAEGNTVSANWVLPRLKSPNRLDSKGRSALWLASRQCDDAMVVRLLERGAQVAIADDQGLAPLHVAAAGGCVEILHHLLRAGAQKNVLTVSGNTALMLAVQNDCSEAATTLMHAGADISQPNIRGDTALLHAVRGGCARLVEQFLAAGADPFRRNELGQSALSLAETLDATMAGQIRSQRVLKLPLLD